VARLRGAPPVRRFPLRRQLRAAFEREERRAGLHPRAFLHGQRFEPPRERRADVNEFSFEVALIAGGLWRAASRQKQTGEQDGKQEAHDELLAVCWRASKTETDA